jgi:hypothetical protein
MAVEPHWLLLTYKVPTEPSRRRMALWRRLKGLGAVYLQNGVCVLPSTPQHVRQLKIIDNEIRDMGGEAVLLEAAPLDPEQVERVIARFRADRDEAYRDVIERCEGFEGEIARETAAGKLTYAELEENEEDLKKLKAWLAKVAALDFYAAPLGPEAREALARCETLLDVFSQQVFEAQQENKLGPGADGAVA